MWYLWFNFRRKRQMMILICLWYCFHVAFARKKSMMKTRLFYARLGVRFGIIVTALEWVILHTSPWLMKRMLSGFAISASLQSVYLSWKSKVLKIFQSKHKNWGRFTDIMFLCDNLATTSILHGWQNDRFMCLRGR